MEYNLPGSSPLWRFPRKEYWSGLLCPPLGVLPDPGIEVASLTSPALAGRFFTTSTTWEAQVIPGWKHTYVRMCVCVCVCCVSTLRVVVISVGITLLKMV